MPKRTESIMYDLTSILDVEAASAIEPGTSLLISGPAMVGKDALMLDALGAGARAAEGTVAVTTSGTAESLLDELGDRAPELTERNVAIVDCRAEGDRHDEESADGAYLNHVSSPADLTGIGIGITKSFERLHDVGRERGRMGLTDLSTMLTYTDKQTVFKFCHVLSSRLDSAGYVGLFTIDSSAHDAQTLQVLKQAFDGMIEVAERDGTRQARLRGVRPEPSPWIEL
jgi:KaiC/GvpD/RAD55 family RecA-like ATPase